MSSWKMQWSITPGNGMRLFIEDQSVETKLSSCSYTNLYRVFPGNWPKVWEDATLQKVLQMLDEHYVVVMTLNALNKEL